MRSHAADLAPRSQASQEAPHVPVEVTGSVVRAGTATRRFRPGDTRSLLTAYLALVRGLRDQRRARSIEVRRADVDALAAYLGVPGSVVVERLAELMGATRSQRAAMVTLFGTGALVIGLAGSTAVRADHGTTTRVVVPTADRPVETTSSLRTAVPSTAGTTAAPADPTTTLVPPTIPDQDLPPDEDAAPTTPAASTPADEPGPGPAPTTDPTDTTVITDIGDPPIPPNATNPAPTTDPTDTTVITDIGDPPIPPIPPTTPATTAPPTTPAPSTLPVPSSTMPPVAPPGTPPVETGTSETSAAAITPTLPGTEPAAPATGATHVAPPTSA